MKKLTTRQVDDIIQIYRDNDYVGYVCGMPLTLWIFDNEGYARKWGEIESLRRAFDVIKNEYR